ncbi:MAG: cytidylate kinase-like family protein [Thermoflexaceae bacterium]|nr:cytidylate kinase-like family protein [Thermoflexaceae bacterium]
MSYHIITISREFGSGGRFIGEKVANRLGFSYYDKEIIAKVAEQTGLAKDYIEKMGEYAPTKSLFSYLLAGRDNSGQSMEDYVLAAQRKIILTLADKEPCVIVGRCADYILRDREDCLNVFIYGNEKEKSERIQKLYEKSPEDAIKLMAETDKKRSLNYNYYTNRTWGDVKNYSLALNSSVLGYEKCIEIITGLINS